MKLAIDGGELHYIPSNAAVHIASSTVFGAKSVEFIPPKSPSPAALRPGAHLAVSAVSLEVNTLFQSLIGLLQKIDPVELNGTLSALAEGLRGHGKDLGGVLSGLNTLTQQLNPKLPTLQQDFRKTAAVANIYADAAPDLVTVFNNTPTIARTVVDEQSNLNSALLSTIGLSNNAYDTLEPAEQNLIDAIKRLRAPLKVTADYSPEFGCLFGAINRGIQEFAPILGVRKAGLFTSSSFLLGAPTYTYPESLPRVNASGGPNCRGLPDLPTKQTGGSWYRAPFLVTDNANIPYEPFTEVQVDAPSTLQWLFHGAFESGTTSMDGYESQRSIMVKVAIFTVTMLLVAFGLVVTFGEFRFGPSNTYHANFIDATRLKGNQKVRIAGVPVGAVEDVKLNPNNTVDVAFSVDKRYTLYSSTRALIRYDNLVGDRFLEITSGPGELRKLPPGGTIDQHHTQPALDLDALLGGLRPVLKGLDADKINTISSYVIDLLQGQGGALSNLLANTNSFGATLGARDHAIGDVITNLNAVLATVDAKGAQFSDTVDQLQKLITGLAQGRDAIAGAIPPLATTTSDLTDLLKHSRRPLQGTLENLRPLAGELNDRLPEVNNDIEQLGEDYLRLSALGAYGAYFNIYFCTVSLKINGPAGSDIIIPMGGQVDPSKGRCAFVNK